MNKMIKVATVQFEPIQFEKQRNIDKLSKLIIEAAEQGAQLIVVPEMATTGYCFKNREEIAPYVETIPGSTTAHFEKIAKQYSCWLVIGMPEVVEETNLYFNSAVLISPEGIAGLHRKTHPYIAETRWAANGDLGHQVFDTAIGKISLLICMDIHFIETARLVAVQGAQLICHLSNWLDERTPAPYWLTRAWENHIPIIESNRWGYERGVKFSGGSCIIDHEGVPLQVIDRGDAVAVCDIELKSENPVLSKRKPKHYALLHTNTYTWNPIDLFNLYAIEKLPQAKQSHISCAQFKPNDDVAHNVQSIRQFIEKAHHQNCELVVFPEKVLTGFNKQNALNQYDEIFNTLIDLCCQYNLHIIIGYIEQALTQKFNSAQVIGPQGIVGHYRQIHINEKDMQWCSAGEEWLFVDIPCGRVGVLLGEDLYIPEAARVLALSGCDIIACAANLSTPKPLAHSGTFVPQSYPIPTGADAYHQLLPRVRAGENNVWLAFANSEYQTEESFGLSGIYSPETFTFPRYEIKLPKGKGLVSLEISTGEKQELHPSHVVRRKDLVRMRQPHYYTALLKHNL
ncbi:nitrilase-related carbon-nitrogen hydrolase [Acinetobacter sp.]|jgi:predicted amidohydrolase|uniref:nitrilase-related carbon-nitrogen hydrolase n=1 Tax=Acinetobacter sp. TaxID=472 RepID=UPI002835F981|nr:nitrilase-related carbon-nitrogen hydrolase [Acinetobacter sp.]MDR0235415.1 amidohydrolase [Acinetobacter sp.]